MEKRIGHYRIVSELGRGGMGVVYRAHEESLNRHVAIKVLGSHLSAEATNIERFIREARSAAKLSHPNIVQIYAIDEHEGDYFFVMEYVTGSSLSERLRSEGSFAPAEAMRIVLQAASGLHAAHEQGIIHRDVKPANLLIDERGLLKITDFGLALAGEAAARLTATGMLMGTPGYLSPEQCRGETVDHRTDIYSLGVTLHEMLTGAAPFSADSPLALLKQIVEVEAPDVCELNSDVDPEARRILVRMMAKDLEQRYQSCAELASDIRQWLGQRGLGSRDPDSIAAGAAVAIGPDPASALSAEALPLETGATVVVDSNGLRPGAGTQPVPPETQAKPVGRPPRRARTALVVVAVLLLGLIAMAAGVVAVRKGMGLVQSLRQADAAATADASPAGNRATQPVTPLEASSDSKATEEPSGSPASNPMSPETAGGDRMAAGGQIPSDADRKAAVPALPASATGSVDSNNPAGRVDAPPLLDQRQAPPAAPPNTAVVLGVGEQLLAGTAREYLEVALRSRGQSVVDREGIPELTDLSPDETPQRGYLRRILQPHAGRLVLARAEYLGERPLYYMGRRDVAFQARLEVHVIDLGSGRPIGQPFSRKLEYTHLSVDRVVEENLGRWLRRTQGHPAGN